MRNQIADKDKRQKTKADMRQKRVLYCTVHGITVLGGILFIDIIIKFQDFYSQAIIIIIITIIITMIMDMRQRRRVQHSMRRGIYIHSWPRGWVREEEKASENKQSNKEAEETDKVEVTPDGVTVGSLRSFRAALILYRPKGSRSDIDVGCAGRVYITRKP